MQNSQSTARAENIGAASIKGYEVSWSGFGLAHLRLYGNYTFQDAKDTSDTFSRGNTLPGRPGHEVHQGLELFNEYGEFVMNLTILPPIFLIGRMPSWSTIVSCITLV